MCIFAFKLGRHASCASAGPTLRQVLGLVEPISKSPEENDEAGELDKTKKVLCVELPADEDATLPLYPGEEALNDQRRM
jgi:hypothetical protein